MAGQRWAVVTGATSGIGGETAKGLADKGFAVVAVGRDAGRGERLVRRLGTGHRFVAADLATRTGIATVVDEVAGATGRLDVLVHGAGVLARRRVETAEGFELNLAIHHLAPFTLTGGLLPQLLAARGRVVNINSEGHRAPLFGAGPVRLDLADLQSRSDYETFQVYSRSKLANLLFALELSRRYPELGVVSLHPGVVRTRIARDYPRPAVAALTALALSPAKGAQPVLALATAESVPRNGYFDRERQVSPSGAALDVDTAARLWAITEQLRGPFVVPVS